MGDGPEGESAGFELPKPGQIFSELHDQEKDVLRAIRQAYYPSTIANEFLQKTAVLPSTKIFAGDEGRNVSVEATWKDRSAQVSGTGPLGDLSFKVNQCKVSEDNPFALPHWSQFGFEISGNTPSKLTSFKFATSDPMHPMHNPSMQFSARLTDGVAVGYVREDNKERAGISANVGNFQLGASEDLRTREFSLSTLYKIRERCQLRVDLESDPHGHMGGGFQLIIRSRK